MEKEYTPRRASVTKWLQDAPDYILDVLDNGGATADRYTVIFTKALSSRTGRFGETWMSYLGMSYAPTHPQGVSMWGEFKAHECANYRRCNARHRIKWTDLPEHIRSHVIARATSNC